MILFTLVRKILVSLAPLALFYLLKKTSQLQPKRDSHRADFDKSKIVEGEIVEEEK